VTLADLLASIVERLDRAGIPYMVTGSLASSYHGEPRTTRDIDIIVDPERDALLRLVDDLQAAGFDVDREVALDAVGERSQFNAIGPDASKVDFIIRRDRPFSVEEFSRRQAADILGTPGFVTTAEDLVLAKLEWAAMSGSERQLSDVAGILAIAGPLDAAYIDRWAEVLGVREAWRRVMKEMASDDRKC
jgi:phosphoglycolate phosphatase-like HAD superfamily hydrolase